VDLLKGDARQRQAVLVKMQARLREYFGEKVEESKLVEALFWWKMGEAEEAREAELG